MADYVTKQFKCQRFSSSNLDFSLGLDAEKTFLCFNLNGVKRTKRCWDKMVHSSILPHMCVMLFMLVSAHTSACVSTCVYCAYELCVCRCEYVSVFVWVYVYVNVNVFVCVNMYVYRFVYKELGVAVLCTGVCPQGCELWCLCEWEHA